jgi:protein-L-isoaspartate(D-aspartate) O-methyltransferase
MTDFARARRMMVDNQLRTSAITDRRILSVMGSVPREAFVPEARRALAYIDNDLPLGISGRALPAPAPFARLVQLAGIGPEDHVLDLGCATGYSAAVIGGLAKSVVAAEPDPGLVRMARTNLAGLGIANAEIIEAGLDGKGVIGGPFDVIVVEYGVDAVPQRLWTHLRDHGRLVALVGTGMTATAHIFVRAGDEIAGRADFNARLPALARDPEAEAFVF